MSQVSGRQMWRFSTVVSGWVARAVAARRNASKASAASVVPTCGSIVPSAIVDGPIKFVVKKTSNSDGRTKSAHTNSVKIDFFLPGC
jgi:hypothetical protein